MTDKVYTPETIQEQPYPDQVDRGGFDISQSSANKTYGAEKISGHQVPRKRVATELLSTSLNTKSKKILAEYQFTESGAIQIGKYVNGASGDMRLTPDGITARNLSNVTTFAIDGTTGDATFKGTIQAGALIAGTVNVGNNTWVIDGDSEQPRIILYNDNIPEIVIGEV